MGTIYNGRIRRRHGLAPNHRREGIFKPKVERPERNLARVPLVRVAVAEEGRIGLGDRGGLRPVTEPVAVRAAGVQCQH